MTGDRFDPAEFIARHQAAVREELRIETLAYAEAQRDLDDEKLRAALMEWGAIA